MPNLTDQVQVYILLGEQLVSIGAKAYTAVKALLNTGDADDDAALARLDALYAARIAQAQHDAQ